MVERISASGEVGEILIPGVNALTALSNAEWGDAAPAGGVATLKRWAELGRLLGMQDASDPGNVDLPRLSEREFEVLALVAAGQSNKLIARALDLSPHTVKRHVARILDRLDLSSRGQAAAWYAKHLAGRGSDGT
jgi:LuxR family maltose regulon positive regulatory protein